MGGFYMEYLLSKLFPIRSGEIDQQDLASVPAQCLNPPVLAALKTWSLKPLITTIES